MAGNFNQTDAHGNPCCGGGGCPPDGCNDTYTLEWDWAITYHRVGSDPSCDPPYGCVDNCDGHSGHASTTITRQGYPYCNAWISGAIGLCDTSFDTDGGISPTFIGWGAVGAVWIGGSYKTSGSATCPDGTFSPVTHRVTVPPGTPCLDDQCYYEVAFTNIVIHA